MNGPLLKCLVIPVIQHSAKVSLADTHGSRELGLVKSLAPDGPRPHRQRAVPLPGKENGFAVKDAWPSRRALFSSIVCVNFRHSCAGGSSFEAPRVNSPSTNIDLSADWRS
jgi:hypothetical protein